MRTPRGKEEPIDLILRDDDLLHPASVAKPDQGRPVLGRNFGALAMEMIPTDGTWPVITT
jgi:hypothetical protein